MWSSLKHSMQITQRDDEQSNTQTVSAASEWHKMFILPTVHHTCPCRSGFDYQLRSLLLKHSYANLSVAYWGGKKMRAHALKLTLTLKHTDFFFFFFKENCSLSEFV